MNLLPKNKLKCTFFEKFIMFIEISSQMKGNSELSIVSNKTIHKGYRLQRYK